MTLYIILYALWKQRDVSHYNTCIHIHKYIYTHTHTAGQKFKITTYYMLRNNHFLENDFIQGTFYMISKR